MRQGRSNFGSLGETSVALNQPKGLDYFLYAPKLRAQVREGAMTVANSINYDTLGIHKKDLPYVSELVKSSEADVDDFVERLKSGKDMNDSDYNFLANTFKKSIANRKIIKETKLNYKKYLEDKKMTANAVMNDKENAEHYMLAHKKNVDAWNGTFNPDGTMNEYKILGTPDMINVEKKVTDDLKVAYNKMLEEGGPKFNPANLVAKQAVNKDGEVYNYFVDTTPGREKNNYKAIDDVITKWNDILQDPDSGAYKYINWRGEDYMDRIMSYISTVGEEWKNVEQTPGGEKIVGGKYADTDDDDDDDDKTTPPFSVPMKAVDENIGQPSIIPQASSVDSGDSDVSMYDYGDDLPDAPQYIDGEDPNAGYAPGEEIGFTKLGFPIPPEKQVKKQAAKRGIDFGKYNTQMEKFERAWSHTTNPMTIDRAQYFFGEKDEQIPERFSDDWGLAYARDKMNKMSYVYKNNENTGVKKPLAAKVSEELLVLEKLQSLRSNRGYEAGSDLLRVTEADERLSRSENVPQRELGKQIIRIKNSVNKNINKLNKNWAADTRESPSYINVDLDAMVGSKTIGTGSRVLAGTLSGLGSELSTFIMTEDKNNNRFELAQSSLVNSNPAKNITGTTSTQDAITDLLYKENIKRGGGTSTINKTGPFQITTASTNVANLIGPEFFKGKTEDEIKAMSKKMRSAFTFPIEVEQANGTMKRGRVFMQNPVKELQSSLNAPIFLMDTPKGKQPVNPLDVLQSLNPEKGADTVTLFTGAPSEEGMKYVPGFSIGVTVVKISNNVYRFSSASSAFVNHFGRPVEQTNTGADLDDMLARLQNFSLTRVMNYTESNKEQ